MPVRGRTDRLTAGILGVGSYLPRDILSNHDLEQTIDTTDEWIFARTGMRNRRIAAADEATSDLAAAAARAALLDAGLEPGEIDLILVATVTSDHVCPSTAAIVQHRIGAIHAAGFDIAAGCTGFVNALSTARQFIVSGAYRHVLVVGAEKLSSILDYRDRETCVLFGDGAGAAVLGPEAGGAILDCQLGMDGSNAETISVPAGGSRQPASAATVAERRHFVRLEGRKVFRFAVAKFCSEIEGLARRNRIEVRDIDWIVPHQANQRIIEAAAERLGYPMAKIVSNVEHYGNTSSASIPIAMAEAKRDGRIRPGQLVATVAFGSGLTWGSALLRW
ncbi:MAG: ketoacyl-ACP synthase III [Planctomycetes bacterium]|nr:ketoacyl-ACP synthase III [Planctomycetota bacterium]